MVVAVMIHDNYFEVYTFMFHKISKLLQSVDIVLCGWTHLYMLNLSNFQIVFDYYETQAKD